MAFELIQIIDDEPEHAILLEYAFRKARYRTNVVHDGLAGLQAVQRLKPALVILDVMLPNLSGYGVCRLLRKDPETRVIPILLITALDDISHRRIAKILGANDLMTKPFSLQQIVQRSKELIRQGAGMSPK
jgi:DNA-binding response OmpR family regulator